MATTMEAPAKCEIRCIIRFLQAEGQNAAEIHRRLCIVYGETLLVVLCENGIGTVGKGELMSMMKRVKEGNP